MNAYNKISESFSKPRYFADRASKRLFFFPLIVCLLLLVSVNIAGAQDLKESGSTLKLPAGLPPLPGPRTKADRLFISRKNVSQFHEVLLAPIAAWIKDGKLAVRIVRNIGFDWRLSPAWEEGTQRNKEAYKFDENYNLLLNDNTGDNGKPQVGFPFGTRTDINKETDRQTKAYKILWNATYAEAASHDVLYGTDIFWIGRQSLLRRSSGLIYRHYRFVPEQPQQTPELQEAAAAKEESPSGAPAESPAELSVSPAALTNTFSGPEDMLRQNLLKLFSPPVVFGFTELDWRYRGEPEDRVWIYSPVTERTREVLQSNRSDPIIEGALSFDDIFVWSAKVQSVFAKVVEEKILLVPYSSLRMVALGEEPVFQQTKANLSGSLASELDEVDERLDERLGGKTAERMLGVTSLFDAPDGRRSTMLWNFETKKLARFAPWAPTELWLVPRPVWILEVSPKDPFYLAGRQVLVVDQETMLPVYKVVYNRRGGYQRTVLGAWNLATSEDGSTRFPFCSFVLAVERGFKPTVAISHHFVRTFLGRDTKGSREMRALFDIAAHEKNRETEPQKKEAAKKEAVKQKAAKKKAG